MSSTFNPQILVEKLAKLNASQTSVEGIILLHLFSKHPPLSLVYCNNEQPRPKGSEFVGEFWKVLPYALRDVIEHGDDFARNAALRLISIWEERKVLGSRGQILKGEVVGRQVENNNRDVKPMNVKLRSSADDIVAGDITWEERMHGIIRQMERVRDIIRDQMPRII